MQKTLPTVTVGIPAYNEEKNIGHLLVDILRQQTQSFMLQSIIVASDGSVDDTENVARAFGDDRITFLDNRDRLGQAERQNQIFAMAKTDVVVLLNADIALAGVSFLEHLVRPIVSGNADLTSSDLLSVAPRTSIAKALTANHRMKNRLFEEWNEGNNIYTCHGPARGFSRRFYQSLRFLESVGEDAFSYLSCVSRGYKYAYARTAVAAIKLPETAQDHLRQSLRFVQSRTRFLEQFGGELVAESYQLPTALLIKHIIIAALKNPTLFIQYLSLMLWVRYKSLRHAVITSTWEVSESSKQLRF